MVLSAILGALLLIAGVLLLRRAWRGGRAMMSSRIAGWLALAAALFVFAVGFGAALGPAIALTLLPAPALVLVVLRRDRAPPLRATTERQTIAHRKRRWARAIGRVLLAIPVAGASASLLAVALAGTSPSLTFGIVAALALSMLFWAIGMAWAVIDPRLWRPLLGLSATALASLAVVLA
jgi:hypothetical protein